MACIWVGWGFSSVTVGDAGNEMASQMDCDTTRAMSSDGSRVFGMAT